MILSLITIKAHVYYSVRVCYFVELTTDYLQDRFLDVASTPPLSFPFSPFFLTTLCLISIRGRDVACCSHLFCDIYFIDAVEMTNHLNQALLPTILWHRLSINGFYRICGRCASLPLLLIHESKSSCKHT